MVTLPDYPAVSGLHEIAGRLSERLTWQTAADVTDGGGGLQREWTDHAILWAAVTPLPATVRHDNDGHEQRSRFAITIRYRNGIGRGQRLIWRGRALAIESVREVDANHILLHLECSSRDGP